MTDSVCLFVCVCVCMCAYNLIDLEGNNLKNHNLCEMFACSELKGL